MSSGKSPRKGAFSLPGNDGRLTPGHPRYLSTMPFAFTDPDELLTHVTDDDRTVLGPVARRHVHGNPAIVHRAAHILILHPENGSLLLQKRSAHKDTQPGKWDTSVGGHVAFGQSYEETALREAEEELGLKLEAGDLRRLYASRFRDEIESENTVTFLCLHAGPFTPQPEEIDALRFWTRAEIEAGMGTDVFTSNLEAEFPAFLACPFGALLR
jgi:isopentenyldiphosphate isomerase